jgi:hypothetical protein
MEALISSLVVLKQILDAGNAITAFSLMLYALTFNIRERSARSLALLLSCVTVVYFGDVLAGTASTSAEIEIWLRFQWVGLAFMPATYLHVSDAILAGTGRPSRGRRRLVVWLSYIISGIVLVAATRSRYIAAELTSSEATSFLLPGPWFPVYAIFVIFCLGFAGINFWRSYKRCLTRTSKRRMRYLLIGSLGPVLGTFPFMMIAPRGLLDLPLIFWGVLIFVNVLVAIQVVMITYSIAYFGVSFPDRVVKSKLAQWILRGPIVASTVLAVNVVVNRLGLLVGIENTRVAPFAMVASLLLLQYVITLIRPSIERWFFYGADRDDVARLQSLEDRLLTTGDLQQFLESILNAGCDVIGVRSAFVAVVGPDGLELEVAVGPEDPLRGSKDLPPLLITENGTVDFELLGTVFVWDIYWLIPLRLTERGEVIGVFGLLARNEKPDFNTEEEQTLKLLLDRATVALADRILQREVFSIVDRLVPQVDVIQRLRAAATYGGASSLTEHVEGIQTQDELVNLVREALGHYWGGPRLTHSPLLALRIVRQSVGQYDGNPVNALRAILRNAIERVKPEGDRRFTAEWMLYNILEMKFLQGRKVRDIAMRLAMSEADLYRKQRVAIEEVSRTIAEMERDAVAADNRKEVSSQEG